MSNTANGHRRAAAKILVYDLLFTFSLSAHLWLVRVTVADAKIRRDLCIFKETLRATPSPWSIPTTLPTSCGDRYRGSSRSSAPCLLGIYRSSSAQASDTFPRLLEKHHGLHSSVLRLFRDHPFGSIGLLHYLTAQLVETCAGAGKIVIIAHFVAFLLPKTDRTLRFRAQNDGRTYAPSPA